MGTATIGKSALKAETTKLHSFQEFANAILKTRRKDRNKTETRHLLRLLHFSIILRLLISSGCQETTIQRSSFWSSGPLGNVGFLKQKDGNRERKECLECMRSGAKYIRHAMSRSCRNVMDNTRINVKGVKRYNQSWLRNNCSEFYLTIYNGKSRGNKLVVVSVYSWQQKK